MCQLGELLKGGLVPVLKEKAFPKPSLRREGIALLPRSLPNRKGPSKSSSLPNHLSSSPGGTGLTSLTGMPPSREQGARVPSLPGEAGDQQGQLAPISTNRSVRFCVIEALGHEELVEAPHLISHRQQQSDGNNHGSLEGDLEVKGSISHYWLT